MIYLDEEKILITETSIKLGDKIIPINSISMVSLSKKYDSLWIVIICSMICFTASLTCLHISDLFSLGEFLFWVGIMGILVSIVVWTILHWTSRNVLFLNLHSGDVVQIRCNELNVSYELLIDELGKVLGSNVDSQSNRQV